MTEIILLLFSVHLACLYVVFAVAGFIECKGIAEKRITADTGLLEELRELMENLFDSIKWNLARKDSCRWLIPYLMLPFEALLVYFLCFVTAAYYTGKAAYLCYMSFKR